MPFREISRHFNFRKPLCLKGKARWWSPKYQPFESLTYEKSITFDYDIEENIYLKCNSAEIQKLLSILLDNAIAHSIKGGPYYSEIKTGEKHHSIGSSQQRNTNTSK